MAFRLNLDMLDSFSVGCNYKHAEVYIKMMRIDKNRKWVFSQIEFKFKNLLYIWGEGL